MASYIVQEKLLPDLILCSSAQRTRETLALLLPSLKGDYQVQIRSDLYRLSEDSYLPIIQSVDANVRSLMIIGHNPATEDTAITLIGSGSEEAVRDLETKYPTGALAVIDFAIDSWADLKPDTGRLDRFIKPRDID